MANGIIPLNNLKDLKKLPTGQQNSARRQLFWLKRHFPKASLVEYRDSVLSASQSASYGVVTGYVYYTLSGTIYLAILGGSKIISNPVNLAKNLQKPYSKL